MAFRSDLKRKKKLRDFSGLNNYIRQFLTYMKTLISKIAKLFSQKHVSRDSKLMHDENFSHKNSSLKFQFSRVPKALNETLIKGKSKVSGAEKILNGVYKMAVILLIFSVFSGFRSKEIESSSNSLTWEKVAVEMEETIQKIASGNNYFDKRFAKSPSGALKNMIDIGIPGKSEGEIGPDESVSIKDLSASWVRFFAYLNARFSDRYYSVSPSDKVGSETFIPEWIMANESLLLKLLKQIPCIPGEEEQSGVSGQAHIMRLKTATMLFFNNKPLLQKVEHPEKMNVEIPSVQGLSKLRAQLKKENANSKKESKSYLSFEKNIEKVKNGRIEKIEKNEKNEKAEMTENMEIRSNASKSFLKGRIIDAVTGKPIQNAVMLADGKIEKVTPAGDFVLTGNPRNKLLNLLVTADGYSGLELKHNFNSKKAKNFTEIRLNPLFSSFQGLLISSEDGKPVENGKIKIGDRLCQTNKSGAFHIQKLRPGYYPVEFSGNGYKSKKELVFIEETGAKRTIRLSSGAGEKS
ncbi:MAG: carboxypeptidase regulatory-like domain-containing protein [Candidatus Riflebacteria bacterium]|nr:carboxypeptidase regulatory-like domain-containing protein [Candidatus Riflebacteria bacterium]